MAEENKIENIANSFDNFMNNLGKTEEEHDEKGNLLSSKTLDGNGNVLYSFAYTYDEAGRQTSKTTFDKDGKAEKRVESAYDENGFRTTQRFDKDNKLTSETRYDDKGREVASLSYYNGEMRQISSYSYKENGDVDEEIRYEMRNGEIRITEQSFYDDALTRHSRRYGADGSVNLEYQPKGASFPYGVSEPTKDDFARDAERAEENLKNYQAEAAFYNDKPAPVKDAWIASFEPKTAEESVKEEPVKDEAVKEDPVQEPVEEVTQAEAESEKQAETTFENVIENGAEPITEENTIQNGAEERTVSNTVENGDVPVDPVLENNPNEKQYVDAEGYSHSVSYDDSGRVSADLKYGQDGKLAGQDLYRDGERTGSVEYAYGQDGSKSMYRYDAQGVQTGYDRYDADGHRAYTAHFRDGKPEAGVTFDEEGRPGTIYRFVQGTNAISTNISYDGDSVYKTVHSSDGQLLRTETTRDGLMSVVDYVSKTAKMTAFDDEGRVQSSVSYEIQGEKLVKTGDAVYTYADAEVQQVQARTYDADGRMTEAYTGLPWGNENDGTTYSFKQDGSYTESTADKTKKHGTVKLFGKTIRTPEQPEFKENPLESMPFVGVDTSANPQISEEESKSYRKHYGAAWNNYVLLDAATVRKDIFTSEGIWFADKSDYSSQKDKELLDQTDEKFVRNEAVTDTAEHILPDSKAQRPEPQSEQQPEPQPEQPRSAQTQEANDNDGYGDDDLGADIPDEELQQSVASAENGDEEHRSKGLGTEDVVQQAANLRQWLNYFALEGSRAKPPYASPFEPVNETKQGKTGAGLLSLKNGNRIVNNPKRIDLILMSSDGKRKEPTFAECMTLVRLGQQKGWTSIRLKGSPEFQKQMYLACRALGMPTKDFVPTEEMLKMGAEMEHAYNCKENVLPQNGNEPERRVPTLTERCDDLDDRFHSLEKVRKKQPVRPKTKEDPYPDLANFDTIRQAEAQGIKPIESVLVNPPQAEGKDAASSNVLAENKETDKALAGLMKAENRRKAELYDTAEKAQRDEWRNRLTVIAEKEAAGTELTKDDKRVKTLANKYGIKADAAEEAEETPPIPRKAFDEKIAEGLRKREIGTEARTALAASIVRRLAAERSAQLIDNETARPLTAKEMVQTAQKEVNAFMANKPPVSEVLKEAGKNNGAAKSAEKKNSQRYSKKTGRDMPQDQQSSAQAQALKKRLQSMGR